MENEEIRKMLAYIDAHILDTLTAGELARAAAFSPSHVSRLFQAAVGVSPMVYVMKRKLAFALRDLLDGKRITRVAMDYGFETHAGFTRAFKRHYGFPPSLARLRLGVSIPSIDEILQNKSHIMCTGGTVMHPEIKEMKDLTVIGYTSRHRMPDVRGISDIPAYWDSIGLDYAAELSTLHNIYAKSHHCEIGCCFDIDEEHGYFTYMLGVGVDEADAAAPQRPGTYRCVLPGGLYAIFRTPFVEEREYVASIQQAWREILTEWLPSSPYRYDDSRMSFEYYDENDHAWLHDGKVRMTIYIPIKE